MSLTVERRAFRRVAVSVEAIVVPDGCVEGDSARILNISREGARVVMTAPVTIGHRIRLILHGTNGALCTAHGRVVALGDGKVSLCFHSMDTEAATTVNALLASGQVELGPVTAPPSRPPPPRPAVTPTQTPVVKPSSTQQGAAAALLQQLQRLRR